MGIGQIRGFVKGKKPNTIRKRKVYEVVGNHFFRGTVPATGLREGRTSDWPCCIAALSSETQGL